MDISRPLTHIVRDTILDKSIISASHDDFVTHFCFMALHINGPIPNELDIPVNPTPNPTPNPNHTPKNSKKYKDFDGLFLYVTASFMLNRLKKSVFDES